MKVKRLKELLEEIISQDTEAEVRVYSCDQPEYEEQSSKVIGVSKCFKSGDEKYVFIYCER